MGRAMAGSVMPTKHERKKRSVIFFPLFGFGLCTFPSDRLLPKLFVFIQQALRN